MIDKILLFPYSLTLACRHAFYNIGLFKSHKAEVPTICVGNITVGGTGKTPHTEMILRMLLEDEKWQDKTLAYYASSALTVKEFEELDHEERMKRRIAYLNGLYPGKKED